MSANSIKQVVAVSSMRPVLTESYDFVGKRRAAKWLWSLVCWLGIVEPHIDEVEVITYRDLQSKDMLNAIFEAINSMPYGKPVKQIIMGRKEFCEFTRNPDVQQMLQFDAGPFHDGPRVFDVPVTVLPWIEGWAAI